MLSWIFPKRCPACRVFLEKGFLCKECEEQWPSVDSFSHCPRCLAIFETEPSHLCGECLQSEKSFSELRALGFYELALKQLILRFKFEGEENLARFFIEKMSFEQPVWENVDIVIPIPLHVRKLKKRGYNQSAVLAKKIAQKYSILWSPFVLKKIRETPAQADLKRNERKANLRKAFIIEQTEKIFKKRVLLVDDVYTTGATVAEASQELIKAGALSVSVFVLARAL